MTSLQHRVAYIVTLCAAWTVAALALDCIDRSKIVQADAAVPLLLIWGAVLLTASFGVCKKTWRSIRSGAVAGLYVGPVAVAANAAIGAWHVCIQRDSPESIGWAISYVLAYVSIIVVPVSWIVLRFSPPRS